MNAGRPVSTRSSAASSSGSSAGQSASVAFHAYAFQSSFSQTVSALQHAVATNGMMVLGTLNQAGAPSTSGLHLQRAESFFVGNPTIAQQMFQMDATIGTEFPMRMYVWVNGSGKTEVGCFQPSALMGAVNPMLGQKGTMMNQKGTMSTKQGTQ